MVPLALTTVVPCAAAPAAVTVSTSPSGSLSFARTAIAIGVPSAVVAASAAATGAWFGPTNGAPATQVKAASTTVPVTPLPDESATVVPLPSPMPQRPRRPGSRRNLERPAAADLRRRARVVPHARFVEHAVEQRPASGCT